MLSVEAVWMMPSITGCRTLSTPIRNAKPNISDGGTSRYTFAANFDGAKPEQKRSTLQKVRTKFSMTSHNL